VVAIVALLGALGDTVSTCRRVTRLTWVGASEPRFELTMIVATICGCRVSVIALLFTCDDTVTTFCRLAASPRNRTHPAWLDGARG
jgi:hypothetical protein